MGLGALVTRSVELAQRAVERDEGRGRVQAQREDMGSVQCGLLCLGECTKVAEAHAVAVFRLPVSPHTVCVAVASKGRVGKERRGRARRLVQYIVHALLHHGIPVLVDLTGDDREGVFERRHACIAGAHKVIEAERRKLGQSRHNLLDRRCKPRRPAGPAPNSGRHPECDAECLLGVPDRRAQPIVVCTHHWCRLGREKTLDLIEGRPTHRLLVPAARDQISQHRARERGVEWGALLAHADGHAKTRLGVVDPWQHRREHLPPNDGEGVHLARLLVPPVKRLGRLVREGAHRGRTSARRAEAGAADAGGEAKVGELGRHCARRRTPHEHIITLQVMVHNWRLE